jgi:hypothetical protein
MSVRIELSDGGTPPSAQYPWSVSGTVNVGDVVALDTSASKTVLRADADNAAARPPIGVCIARNGSLAQVALNGEIAAGLSGLTRGTAYWLSTTPGALVSSKPGSSAYAVGVAVSATELLLDGCVADLTGGAGGGVTSAGITSSDFTVSNSPVTTTGTIGLALNTVSVAKGGTGLTSASEQGAMPYATSTSAYTMQSVSPTFKNRVINGGMTINQRAAASVSTDASYVVDRWRPRVSGIASTWSLAQSALVPTGFSNSLGFSVTSGAGAVSAGTFSTFLYLFEGTSISDFAWGSAAAKTITISFWARSSIAGTYCVSVRNASATRSYVAEYSIISSNTWQKVSATVSGDTSGTWATGTGTGLILEFNLGTGSNLQGAAGTWLSGNFIASANQTNLIGVTGATFYLTGVQLEVGSVATNFELRPQQVELALCQRYFYRLSGPANLAVASGVATSTANVLAYTKYPQAMRATPTISAATLRIFPNSAAGVVGAVNYGDNSAALNISGGTRTAGQGAVIAATTTASSLDFSAEL